jgi:hypothetical protein
MPQHKEAGRGGDLDRASDGVAAARVDTPENKTSSTTSQARPPKSTRSAILSDFSLDIESVNVLPNRRPIQRDSLEPLMKSMTEIGLQHPITVRLGNDLVNEYGEVYSGFVLVAGRHRLEAARQLGWSKIACHNVGEWTATQARKWEISENLHRTNMSRRRA